MATIRKIKRDHALPDYYYVMPNKDRIDITVRRSPKGNVYTCMLPAPHGQQTFNKMAEMREYFETNFEST